MLIIRLKPLGRKHRRVYRIVVASKRKHVSKKSIADIGFFDPVLNIFKVDKEKLDYYSKLNVEFSDTAKALCVKYAALPA